MSLREQLAEISRQSAEQLPADVQEKFKRFKEYVESLEIDRKALGAGAMAPDFTAPRASGGVFTLSQQLAMGPLVLLFYRGRW